MSNNEETIYLGSDSAKVAANNNAKAKKSSWKAISIGGTAGILLGGGVIYAAKAYADHHGADGSAEDGTAAADKVKVAGVNEGQSFTDAFNQARAEVGPGGVFHWHDGIYSTYTSDEWNAMSDADKATFAARVNPEVRPSEMAGASDNDDVIVAQATDAHPVSDQADVVAAASDVQETDNSNVTTVADNTSDSDVRVVGVGEVQGHIAVGYDITGDGQADVAVIDVDDSNGISRPDIVADREGHVATVGDLMDGQDGNTTVAGTGNVNDQLMQQGTYENPDDTAGADDGMNDGSMEFQTI